MHHWNYKRLRMEFLYLSKLPCPDIDAPGMTKHSEAHDGERETTTLTSTLASREFE